MNVTNRNIVNPQGALDVNAAKAVFNLAHDFITKLWKILPLPNTEVDEGDDDDMPNFHHNKMKRFGKGTRAKSLDELRSKLETMRGKRKNYKDKLETKGLKNRLNKKQKNEKRKLKKKLMTVTKVPKQEVKVKAVNIPPEPAQPVFNSGYQMIFTKFSLESSSVTQKTLSSDPKAILKKLEKQEEKIKNLEMTDSIERVKAIRKSLAWKTALDKAEGKKLKDNPALLKKSIKRRTDRKQSSKKKWVEREESMKKEIDKKQRKRAENIESRKKQVKKNKVKKFAKKGRIVL